MEKEKSRHFHAFVRAFYPLNPTAALLYIQSGIDASEEDHRLPTHDEIQRAKNHHAVQDDILTILSGFADTVYLDEALELFFEYYTKCSGKFIQFYHAARAYYAPDRHSHDGGCYTQMRFVRKLRAALHAGQTEAIRLLFTELAPELLKLEYTSIEAERDERAVHYRMWIAAHPNVLAYRAEVWQELDAMAQSGDLTCLETVLEDYGEGCSGGGKEVVAAEAEMLHTLVTTQLDHHSFRHCLIAERLVQRWSECDCVPDDGLKTFLDSAIMQSYQVLKKPDRKIPYERWDDVQKKRITQYIADKGFAGMQTLIDTCVQFEEAGGNTWYVGTGLGIAMEATARAGHIVPAIKYYIACNTPLCQQPMPWVEQLFSQCSIAQVRDLIFTPDYDQKIAWQFAYYAACPSEGITDETLKELYAFMNDVTDARMKIWPYSNVWWLEKYEAVDPNFFITLGEMVLKKFAYAPCMARIYCESLLHDAPDAIDTLVSKFAGHLDLLGQLYLQTIGRNNGIRDYSGDLARALMRAYPPFVNDYAALVAGLMQQRRVDTVKAQLRSMLEDERDSNILNCIVDTVVARYKKRYYELSPLFDALLLPDQEKGTLKPKQDAWIRHQIAQHADDALRMQALFATIAQLSDNRRIEYMLLYLEHNPAFDDFVNLPLIPRTLSYFGSAVPVYTHHRKCLCALGKGLKDVRFLSHQQYVFEQVDHLQEHIEQEELHDILTGR